MAGVEDAYRQQTVKAFVKLRVGQSLDAEDLTTFLKDKLSAIELPKQIEFRDELPKTLIGKLSKKEVIAEEAAKRNARNRRRDFAGHRADAGRRAHLGVERLVLRRPTVLEQKHDALVPGQTAGLFDGFLPPEQVRQRQATQSQASHREKLAPAPMVRSQPQHNSRMPKTVHSPHTSAILSTA